MRNLGNRWRGGWLNRNALGMLLGALTMAGFLALFAGGVTNVWPLAALFALAGVYIAFEDALKGVLAAERRLGSDMHGEGETGAQPAPRSFGPAASSSVMRRRSSSGTRTLTPCA